MLTPRIAALASALAIGAAPAFAVELAGLRNAHDPGTVTRDGDTWFNFTTGENGIWHSTSRDLVTWSAQGKPVFSTYPGWIANKIPGFTGSMWAPDVIHMNGRYYLYYSVSAWGTTTSAIGVTRILGAGHQDIEAPYITRNGQYYYLFVNRGACCKLADSTYSVQVLRATSVTGPYSGARTILPNTDGKYRGPGHVAVLKQDGCHYVSTHYYDLTDKGNAKLDFLKMSYSGGWPAMTRNFSSFAGCGGISDGAYAIKSRASGKVLTVAGAATANGAMVQQATDSGAKHQSWYVIGQGDGNYSIINAGSLRSLDNYGNSTSAGTPIAQWEYWAGSGQKWRFASPAAGWYTVGNQSSAMALDVKGGATQENAPAIQSAPNDGASQQWALQRR